MANEADVDQVEGQPHDAGPLPEETAPEAIASADEGTESKVEAPAESAAIEPAPAADTAVQRTAKIEIPLPVKDPTGYMPTTINVTLSPSEAATLRLIREGLVEAGARISSPDEAVRRLLEMIGSQLK